MKTETVTTAQRAQAAPWRAIGLAAAVCILVVIVDQVSKAVVRSTITIGEHVHVLPGVDFVNVQNPGIAFGMFADGGVLVVLLTLVAFAALVAFFVTHLGKPLIWLPTGLLLGGAIGNVIDRVRDSTVTDFVQFPRWPAFNVADTIINVGVVVLLFVLYRLSKKDGQGEMAMASERTIQTESDRLAPTESHPDTNEKNAGADSQAINVEVDSQAINVEADSQAIVVQEDEDGQRLDVFLAPRIGLSRAAVQKLIEAGQVEVDGVARAKRFLVTKGSTIEVNRGSLVKEEQAPSAEFSVVYEDEYLMVVDKPAGVVVHPARAQQTGTLVQALAGKVEGGDDPTRPGVVHRLDRNTSGLMVLARSEFAYRKLKELIGARVVTREYLALVEGRPSAQEGKIDAPLGRDRRVRTRMSVDTASGREAVTYFNVEQEFADTTLLRVRLQTGRTHQIRAHLLAIGHPVVGDPEYGTAGQYGLRRQFLHAYRLAFTHPITGEQIDKTSPLPDDLRLALDRAAVALKS